MKQDYTMDEKLAWTTIFVYEFAHHHGLSMKQACNYLSRWNGLKFIDNHYAYVHTQSFPSMVSDITQYCHREGGALV